MAWNDTLIRVPQIDDHLASDVYGSLYSFYITNFFYIEHFGTHFNMFFFHHWISCSHWKESEWLVGSTNILKFSWATSILSLQGSYIFGIRKDLKFREHLNLDRQCSSSSPITNKCQGLTGCNVQCYRWGLLSIRAERRFLFSTSIGQKSTAKLFHSQTFTTKLLHPNISRSVYLSRRVFTHDLIRIPQFWSMGTRMR